MSYRRLVAFGLIAGMTYTEIHRETPGFILDMYAEKVDYDMQVNYGKRILHTLGRGG